MKTAILIGFTSLLTACATITPQNSPSPEAIVNDGCVVSHAIVKPAIELSLEFAVTKPDERDKIVSQLN